MVKVSVNRYIQKRIEAMQKETETSFKKLRKKLLKNLEEIFEASGKIVKGEMKYQRINGKMVKITIPQRKRWLLIAQHTAETITKIAENINEKEIKTKLEELQNLVNELQSKPNT